MGAKLGGGGGSKYTVEQNAEINVTPFVDVMLVLLIIFMVSIPTATVSIKLDVPPATPSENHETKKPVFISVMGPDDIYIGANRTSIATLPQDVAAALQSPDPTNERILIRGDKNIQYDDFVKVLNTLQQNGYTKIGLIAEDVIE